ALLTALTLAASGREMAALLRPRPASLAWGAAAAVVLVGACWLGFHLLAPRLFPLRVAAADLYARFPERDATRAVLVPAGAFAEEIIWRGGIQSALARRCGRLTFLASAVIYAASHATSGSWLLVALALVLGAFWSLLRQLTGSLIPAVVSHLAF